MTTNITKKQKPFLTDKDTKYLSKKLISPKFKRGEWVIFKYYPTNEWYWETGTIVNVVKLSNSSFIRYNIKGTCNSEFSGLIQILQEDIFKFETYGYLLNNSKDQKTSLPNRKRQRRL